MVCVNGAWTVRGQGFSCGCSLSLQHYRKKVLLCLWGLDRGRGKVVAQVVGVYGAWTVRGQRSHVVGVYGAWTVRGEIFYCNCCPLEDVDITPSGVCVFVCVCVCCSVTYS